MMPAFLHVNDKVLPGIQEPIGFFDPLGFSADNDEATFKRRRTVEIKHGRVAMFATMGYITPYFTLSFLVISPHRSA
jgi:hypothetical protein